ncbi:MAG: citrate synthase [candidate division Zixibacteria bacterium]|nr:citrate synthase [candidate division Zixibacteria bacterium]NIS47764.1 citrate synthase [candidate division Zixibacteria bacterium]NIU15870.1 citrate synthase [candidate division Zixibacteria bacterium]NIV08016.1 citrate synthase [candidate division Zixibacteria bacterium]NIW41924.1 citrate synthase [candidate division Zixibacteria bacterium]
MENLLEKIIQLEQEHDKLDPEFVSKKRIKLGLRNTDGTGVVAGVTSKGQVKAFKRDRHGKNIPIPGKLIYCGYDVEDIVADIEVSGRFGFEETIFLLLTGELPTKDNLDGLNRELGERRSIPEKAREVIKINAENDDQMGALHAAVAVLHKFDPNPKSTDIREVTRQCVDLIAKFPSLIAYNYCVARDSAHARFVEPRKDFSTAQNFLYMLTGEEPDIDIARAFDIALILHAEHGGGNNSTFTVRTVSSSLTDTYMAICAGVASLAGHLHGGANEAVMNMMEGIKSHVKDWNDDAEVKAYLEGLMDKKYGDRSGKIYGMGHAVYVISDPRAPILRKKAEHFAQKAGRMDEYNLYNKVAELAVQVVKEKKGRDVCVNVDFYSGFLYDMMNIPQELYTPIFAMSRVSGWAAHRIEEIIQGRLIRPAYISSLKLKGKKFNYLPLDKR